MFKLFKNMILALVALLLGVVILPFSLWFAVVKFIYKPKHLVYTFSNICYIFAKSIDMMGNGVCYVFFNAVMIKDDAHHPFGDETETISRVLGINKKFENLTWFGCLISSILNKIDANHVERASM